MNHGKAGDVDYGTIGAGYTQQRRPDPRFQSIIHEALGTVRVVLNVGAGRGSYEPLDRYVIAVEPAEAMRSQRAAHLAPALSPALLSVSITAASSRHTIPQAELDAEYHGL